MSEKHSAGSNEDSDELFPEAGIRSFHNPRVRTGSRWLAAVLTFSAMLPFLAVFFINLALSDVNSEAYLFLDKFPVFVWVTWFSIAFLVPVAVAGSYYQLRTSRKSWTLLKARAWDGINFMLIFLWASTILLKLFFLAID